MAEELEKKIGVKFKNKTLLKQALTHRSYLNEHREKNQESNERLEFLGDAVLELWTTQQLFQSFNKFPEGILTNIRAAVVCTESLAETASQLQLGKYLLLSKGEEKNNGRENSSLLADTFEAIIGALYLDGGYEKVNEFLNQFLLAKLIKFGKSGNIKDSKTNLQELTQANYKATPYYKIVKESGPDHSKTFTVAVYLQDSLLTTGCGLSKREAEENAASEALTLIEKKCILPKKIKT